jgi:acyl carrier protein
MQVETQIEEKILALLSEFIPHKKKLCEMTKKTELQRELGVNSIALLSLVFRVEEEFKVDLSQIDFGAELAKLRTVGDLLEISKELLANAVQRVS